VTTNVTPSVVINASATTLCSGTSATFTASPTNGGTTPSYQWKVNGINVGTNSASYSTSSLQNGDIVTCVLSSSLPCVTSSSVTGNSITVTVTSIAPVSVSIGALSGTTICQGTNTNFSATPVNGGTNPSYQWQINGINVGSNSSTFNTSALLNGDVVTCLLTSNAACPSPTSVTSNAISMTVNTVAAPTVIITSNQGTNICDGTSVVFTAAGTNAGSAPNYQWKVNGVNVGSNQAFYSSSGLNQGDIVTCVLTSNANCVNGQTATSNALVFNVTNYATPSVSISSSSSSICQGTNVIFTATPIFGGNTPSYQWYLNGSPVGFNSSVYSNSGLVNGDIVTCILNSNYTCVTSSTVNSNAITMVVNPSVSAVVSISSNSGTNICQGTTVVFSASPVNGGTNPTYQWQINGSNVGSNSSSLSTSTLLNGDVVTCQMISSAACPTPNPSLSNSITMIVNSLLTPTVSITSSLPMPVCPGTPVTFLSNITNGGTTPIYQWNVNGVNQGTNSSSFSPGALTNGDAIVCVLSSNAQCLSTSNATSSIITYQETSFDLSLTQATNLLTSNQSAASYQWIDCSNNQPISGATQQSLTIAQNGTYAVEITLGSCVDTSACIAMTYNSLDDSDMLAISLYPNPARDVLHFVSQINESWDLDCFDVSGRIVHSWKGLESNEEIRLEGFSTGTYYFEFNGADYRIIKKIEILK
jgi:hypothetical protein